MACSSTAPRRRVRGACRLLEASVVCGVTARVFEATLIGYLAFLTRSRYALREPEVPYERSDTRWQTQRNRDRQASRYLARRCTTRQRGRDPCSSCFRAATATQMAPTCSLSTWSTATPSSPTTGVVSPAAPSTTRRRRLISPPTARTPRSFSAP